ncbi:MAG: hypothetical protein ACYSSI_12400, partial [Planctomycetota bacterium]
MMEWIRENYQWVFGGVGLLLIYPTLWFVKWLWDKIRGWKSEDRGEHKVRPLPKSEDRGEHKVKPLPKEIKDDIESRPPFQQNEASKHYVGLKV